MVNVSEAALLGPQTAAIEPVETVAASKVTTVTAVAVIGVGLTVLTGWITGVEVLKSIVPGIIVMIPNTATAFVLAGIALFLLRRESRPRGIKLLAQACATVVLLVGFLTFLERMFGLNFGIDLLLFAEQIRQYPYLPPGQMASNSTVAFTVAGAALLFLDAEPQRSPAWRETLATIGLAISGVALIGYIYGAQSLYIFDPAAGMALLTALSFMVLHTGILFARPTRGRAVVVAANDATATFVRRLLLATITVPILAGYALITVRERQLISRENGVAILIAVTISVLIAVVIKAGAVLRGASIERERLLAESDAANRAKSNFLATMSHELRTPLNAIIGYSSLMTEGVTGELNPTQKQQADRVRMSAQHLLSLIDQILGVSRLEAGKDTVSLRPTSVQGLVDETCAIAGPLFNNRALELVVDPVPQISIRTDPDRVRQILLNLIGNAVKFSEQGDVRLCVTHDITRDLVCFEVTDQGVGIAAEHQEKIFEPFWQVEMNTTRRHQGAGLGLSVSRQLARLLKGDLTVRSAPGAGATFVLELPA
jgi:signal transduction histidine kinase